MIYGYTRVSTKKQLEGHGLEAQKKDIINKYTEISKNTCVKCGKQATYMTTWGYIAPWCDECEVKRFAF